MEEGTEITSSGREGGKGEGVDTHTVQVYGYTLLSKLFSHDNGTHAYL